MPRILGVDIGGGGARTRLVDISSTGISLAGITKVRTGITDPDQILDLVSDSLYGNEQAVVFACAGDIVV